MIKAPLRPGTRPVGAAQLAVKDELTYLLVLRESAEYSPSTAFSVAPLTGQRRAQLPCSPMSRPASASRPGSARTPRSGLLVDPQAAEQQRPTTSAANASRSMVPAGTDALGSQALRAKNARIRAEQDRQMLQNRINRLIIEEEKAAKRISETRRRAKEIWDLKRRNEANQAARADAGSWMSSEQHLQRQLLTQARSERASALDSSKAALAHMRKEEVSVLRQMRRENEEAVVAQRNMEHSRCVARKQSVKLHQQAAAQRRNKVREAALQVQPQSRPLPQPHRNTNTRTEPHHHPTPLILTFSLPPPPPSLTRFPTLALALAPQTDRPTHPPTHPPTHSSTYSPTR